MEMDGLLYVRKAKEEDTRFEDKGYPAGRMSFIQQTLKKILKTLESS